MNSLWMFTRKRHLLLSTYCLLCTLHSWNRESDSNSCFSCSSGLRRGSWNHAPWFSILISGNLPLLSLFSFSLSVSVSGRSIPHVGSLWFSSHSRCLPSSDKVWPLKLARSVGTSKGVLEGDDSKLRASRYLSISASQWHSSARHIPLVGTSDTVPDYTQGGLGMKFLEKWHPQLPPLMLPEHPL